MQGIMGPGLQLLAITSGVAIASQVRDVTQGAIENFAELLASDSPASTESHGENGASKTAASLNDIHAAIRAHLREMNLPEGTPLQIEVRENGNITVETDSSIRLELEDAIARDEVLVDELQQYAWERSGGERSHRIHWPPSSRIATSLDTRIAGF
ncbi:MAG: hypothetical protein R3C05_19415 [Pirellulaceae bacterium]